MDVPRVIRPCASGNSDLTTTSNWTMDDCFRSNSTRQNSKRHYNDFYEKHFTIKKVILILDFCTAQVLFRRILTLTLIARQLPIALGKTKEKTKEKTTSNALF